MAWLSGDCPFVCFSWDIGYPSDLHTHFFQCKSLIAVVRMRTLLSHCSPHVFWGPSQMGTHSLDGLLCSVFFCLQCRFHSCHWTLFLCLLHFHTRCHLGASHISLQTQSRHFLGFSSVFYSNFFPEAHFSSTAFRTGKRGP